MAVSVFLLVLGFAFPVYHAEGSDNEIKQEYEHTHKEMERKHHEDEEDEKHHRGHDDDDSDHDDDRGREREKEKITFRIHCRFSYMNLQPFVNIFDCISGRHYG